MRTQTAGIIGLAVLAAACATPEQRLAANEGAAITQAEGVKAFSDAVLGHCLPAVHGRQAFKDFEVKGVTPLRKLEDHKIPMFDSETPQIWQMVDAVVQIQLSADGDTCRVASYGLPAQATLRLVGNTALQTDFNYSDEPVGFPQEGTEYRRVLTAGTGDEEVTLYLTGMETPPGVAGDYGKINAIVTRDPIDMDMVE